MHCGFCFAQFKDVRRDVLPEGHLPRDEALRVVRLLADAGFKKITFAGGEPFLCPWIGDLLREAHACGMVTCAVTNGTGVTEAVSFSSVLDWLVISIDSVHRETLLLLGRATAGLAYSEAEYLAMCLAVVNSGIQLKINTVVTQRNWQENLGALIAQARPARWKILQMLPVAGQNDRHKLQLHVTAEQFYAFVSAQRAAVPDSVTIVAEDNNAMTGSYAMLDPAGRFFDNVDGSYTYSDSILLHGVVHALSQVVIDPAKFIARGGYYDWSRTEAQHIADIPA